MLTNNQFKYIGYGIMIFIILILLSNIYITKINNNYTASGLIEGFDVSTSQKKISDICNKDNKDKIISYAKSFGNDVPKLKGVYVMSMMKDIEAMHTGDPKRSTADIMKDITYGKNMIDALDTIGDNVKYLENDCGGGIISELGGGGGLLSGFGGSNDSKNGGSSSSNDKSSSGGWFSDGGTNNNKSSNNKSSSGGMFGGMFSSGGSNNKSSNQESSNSGGGWFSSGGSNNNKSSSGGWFGGDDSD